MIPGRRRQRSSITTTTSTTTTADPIVIDNLKYYPDRFYLNKPTTISSTSASNPLFIDLPHLLSSLDLSCAIIGTYVIDPSYVTEAMPSLFGRNDDDAIPVFVMHGMKRLNEKMAETDSSTTTTDIMTDNDIVSQSSSLSLCHDSKNGDGNTAPKNEQTITSPSSSSPTVDGTDNKPPTSPTPTSEEDEWMTTNNPHHPFQKRLCQLGPKVILSQIDPVQLIRRPTAAAAVVGGGGSSGSPPSSSSSCQKKNHSNSSTSTMNESCDVIVIDDNDDEKDKNENKNVQEKRCCDVERKWCRGVHHPKYLLLFEKDKSLIVIITTSNLTRPLSMDASWIQRFRPVTIDNNIDHHHPSSSSWTNNDFGIVLSDFLLKSSEAVKAGHPSPWDFLKRHLGVNGGEDFEKRWRFDEAGVYLVSTVPGDHRTVPPPPLPSRQRHTTTTKTTVRHQSKTSLSYGPERVSSILQSLQQSQSQQRRQPSPPPPPPSNKKRKFSSFFSKKKKGLARFSPPNPPAHPSWLLSHRNDRLVMQHTSWGGNWTRGEMERLIGIYMTTNDRSSRNSRSHDDNDDDCNGVLNRTTIIWPSRDFINDCHAHLITTNNKNNNKNGANHTIGNGSNSIISTPDNIPYALLSSKTFNTIDLAILSRMALYETISPFSDNVVLPPISPHVKSYCRILADDYDDDDETNKSRRVVCDCHLLAWFMITSACLSRGAQGHRLTTTTMTNCDYGSSNGRTAAAAAATGNTDDDHHGMMTTTFGNFELGVLFVSRFDIPGQERMYTSLCSRGRECRRRRRCRSSIDDCNDHGDDDNDDDGSVFVTVNDNKKTNEKTTTTTTTTTAISHHCHIVRATPLPIPYNLRSSLYQSDPDDADFDFDPFMHDVEDGAETVGLMSLTPRGRQQR